MTINPGIRRTVAWLQSLGFNTTDSGDGETHDFECDRTYPYVSMEVAPEKLASEADRLRDELATVGVVVGELSMAENAPAIQATYDPGNGVATIDLTNVKDTDFKIEKAELAMLTREG